MRAQRPSTSAKCGVARQNWNSGRARASSAARWSSGSSRPERSAEEHRGDQVVHGLARRERHAHQDAATRRQPERRDAARLTATRLGHATEDGAGQTGGARGEDDDAGRPQQGEGRPRRPRAARRVEDDRDEPEPLRLRAERGPATARSTTGVPAGRAGSVRQARTSRPSRISGDGSESSAANSATPSAVAGRAVATSRPPSPEPVAHRRAPAPRDRVELVGRPPAAAARARGASSEATSARL